MTNLKVDLVGESKSSGSLAVRVKHNFSKKHFRAAVLFAAEARTMETTISAPSEEERSRHSAQVTASVLSSAVFLEASINELFLSAIDQDFNILASFDAESCELLQQFWGQVEKYPILEKYQIALALLRKGPFDRGGAPYQDADSLIKLRDSLVHYKPEWDDELGTHQRLEDRLKGRFPLNPYGAGIHLWFPHQCLGAGCADWAVTTARAFSEEFCKRLAIPVRTA
jgi:hypothetical protein